MGNVSWNMKRKTALLLACVMIASTPMTALAGTEAAEAVFPAEQGDTTPSELPTIDEIVGTEGVNSGETVEPEAEKEAEEGPVATDITEDITSSGFNESKEIDGVIVKVTADEGVFPEDAWLEVTKVEDADMLENIDEAIDEASKDASEDDAEETYAFDIKIYTGMGAAAQEVQPDNSKGSVKVTFALAEKPEVDQQIKVYHVDEIEPEEAVYTDEGIPEYLLEDSDLTNDLDKKKPKSYSGATAAAEEEPETVLEAEELTAEVNTENIEDEKVVEVTVEAESFSYYVVRFTNSDKGYTIAAGQTVDVEAILRNLNLSFSEVISATLSNAADSEYIILHKEMSGDNVERWKVCANADASNKSDIEIRVTLGNNGNTTGVVSIFVNVYSCEGTGWQIKDDAVFYINEDGNYCEGFKTIGEKTYYFDPQTKRQVRGWFRFNNKWGWTNRSGSSYLDVYVFQNRWLNDSGSWYYFNENYEMLENGTYDVPVKSTADGTKTTRSVGFDNNGIANVLSVTLDGAAPFRLKVAA